MKEKTIRFIRDVFFTTAICYLLMSFALMGLLSLTGEKGGGQYGDFAMITFLMGKLACVLLFSLCLGFANRLENWKKPAALRRVVHFFVTLAAYVVSMVLLFLGAFGAETISTKTALLNILLFLVGYPIVLGVCALGRRIFLPREKRGFKSILD